MKLFDRIFAALYDRVLAGSERAGLADRRRRLIERSAGRVLEIGAGTGLNLSFYPRDLERLVLTEPSAAMASKLQERLEDPSVEVVLAPAESLPFAAGEFDTVVATLTLCTVKEPMAALAEIRRVLAPGGQLLLIEHVRSEDPRTARLQDRLERPWRIFGNGCHCNRTTEQLVRAAGFDFSDIDHGEVPKAPAIVRPLIEGRAFPLA